MTQTSSTIVFFGSGPVAAESLRLLHTHTPIEAVVTKPNPAHHRGRAPVIDFCEANNIAYQTVSSKQELTEFFASRPYTSDLGIVIDFGIIIDQIVIDYFSLGIVNSHFSLLPEWRGADPITFSLLSGQPTTGVSLMTIVAAMDEGPLLAQDTLVIQPSDTSITLTQKLIQLSDAMLQRYLPMYSANTLHLQPQSGEPTYSRKLTKGDGIIDWTKPAVVLEREIRAYYGWPKSIATLGGQQFIITSADVVNTSGEPGSYSTTKKELLIYCGSDALNILTVQPVNKKEMPIQAFLSGYTL